MTDHAPSTPRSKLTLVQTPPRTSLTDTEPLLDGIFTSDEARKRNPLGAACTLVWLAHTALLEVSQGTPASADEWQTTRAVVETAVRYLVLARAQRVVDVSTAYSRASNSPVLAVLRQRTNPVSRSSEARGKENSEVNAVASGQVWRLARRLELMEQCLFDWNVTGAIGVSNEEVFALAQELHFVYRELQALAGQRN